MAEPAPVRRATPNDAADCARLLHDFNTEYDEFTPGVEVLTGRLERLIEAGETTVLLAGSGPDGVAVLRFRPLVFEDGLHAYLEELYVAPALRGQGLGRALLDSERVVVVATHGPRGWPHVMPLWYVVRDGEL